MKKFRVLFSSSVAQFVKNFQEAAEAFFCALGL